MQKKIQSGGWGEAAGETAAQMTGMAGMLRVQVLALRIWPFHSGQQHCCRGPTNVLEKGLRGIPKEKISPGIPNEIVTKILQTSWDSYQAEGNLSTEANKAGEETKLACVQEVPAPRRRLASRFPTR